MTFMRAPHPRVRYHRYAMKRMRRKFKQKQKKQVTKTVHRGFLFSSIDPTRHGFSIPLPLPLLRRFTSSPGLSAFSRTSMGLVRQTFQIKILQSTPGSYPPMFPDKCCTLFRNNDVPPTDPSPERHNASKNRRGRLACPVPPSDLMP